MSAPETHPDPVAAFEDALKRRDIPAAQTLYKEQPDPERAFQRMWNIGAYGIDVDTMLSIEDQKDIAHEAARRAVRAILADHAGRRTCDNFQRYLLNAKIAKGPIHERDAPWIIHQLVTGKALTAEEAESGVHWAWAQVEFPEANLDTDAWLAVFRSQGRTQADVDEEYRHEVIPTEPVRVYRGAVSERATGMAWSGDPSRATWFARRWEGATGRKAEVFTTVVVPEQVLARYVGRQEDEYVLDPTGLALGSNVSIYTGEDSAS